MQLQPLDACAAARRSQLTAAALAKPAAQIAAAAAAAAARAPAADAVPDEECVAATLNQQLRLLLNS